MKTDEYQKLEDEDEFNICPCTQCNGTGFEPGTCDMLKCHWCHGTGNDPFADFIND